MLRNIYAVHPSSNLVKRALLTAQHMRKRSGCAPRLPRTSPNIYCGRKGLWLPSGRVRSCWLKLRPSARRRCEGQRRKPRI
ncbi:hypothetical protein EMPG_12739 [Blastomyces silverae]|uniref:Uncharacterized protein n=1 Tax=Blastomyces silverae TaxID=2060906 RepID=A0A0H1BMB9_9EURO|nr:hypothetical protein EMPG_12739 [Blastomyces silverae]